MILDLHTHLPAPKDEALISASPAEVATLIEEGGCPSQLWSVGVHPWKVGISGLLPDDAKLIEELAGRDDVPAIGETGIDMVHEGAAPLFAQINAFLAQMKIAKRLNKPVVIHAVKAADVVIPLVRDAGVKAVVHGFRVKPTVAAMFIKAGIGLSFGEKFNPESLLAAPLDMIYAETDESTLSIHEIIAGLHEVRPEVTEDLIADNISRFLS